VPPPPAGPQAQPAPAPALPAPAPQGLAALAAWWEEHDGAERGDGPAASRLLDAGPPARRAPSRAVTGDAGEVDDGALLALDRFTAALEQVLISEAASHGIEVER